MSEPIYLLTVYHNEKTRDIAFTGFTSNPWLLKQCVNTCKLRFTSEMIDGMEIVEYESLSDMYSKSIVKVSGDDKICVFKITSPLSPNKGKSVVTTISDVYSSNGGGFISYAERFMIMPDLDLADRSDYFMYVIRNVFKDKAKSELLCSAFDSMNHFIRIADANIGYDERRYAFNLDNWDIVQYGVWKGWFNLL